MRHAFALACAALAACAAAAPAGSSTDFFLVVPAATATLSGGAASLGGNTFTAKLVLEQPADSVVWFANKPQRDAGAVPLPAIATPAFASVWEAGPNAALVGTTPAGRRVTVTLALAAPAHDPAARTLTFNASALAPPAFVVAGAGGQEGTEKGGSAAAAAVTDDGRPLVLHGATLFVDQFNGFGSVPMGPGYSGTSCLLPAGCLSAVVCGWCPSRWGGGGWGWG